MTNLSHSLLRDESSPRLESSANKDCGPLLEIFNKTFASSHQTRLQSGGEEPIYLPADEQNTMHRIVFSHDYFASALHEIAHWCVAGNDRRLQLDYGYWYAPDGRSVDQQQEFERVEVKPQALEWMFSVAAGVRFRVSADNLALGVGPSKAFKDSIWQQVLGNCEQGVNSRTARFLEALRAYYKTDDYTQIECYPRIGLDE